MNIFKNNYWLALASIFSVLLLSYCRPEEPDMVDDEEMPIEITEFTNAGFFIVNQGLDGTEEGSISFYHKGFEVVAKDIFQEANSGEFIGKGLQSMKIINGDAYIVSRFSNKIVIADPFDMTKKGEITGFNQPMHIVQVAPNRAYVSQFGSTGEYGSIQIVDLDAGVITDSIAVRPGPLEMIRVGNNVWVANTGGIQVDSIITKINVINNEILKTVNVGLTPSFFEVDRDLNLWVMSRGQILDPGNPEANIKSRLMKIENDEVVLSINLAPAANGLTINRTRDKLYFVQNGWVYEHLISATSLSLVPYIERNFLGLDIDPSTDNLIGLDAKDLEEPGEIYIFDNMKTPLDTLRVGVTPNSSVFY